MALVLNTLESALKSLFAAMRDGSKTDAWMAARIADAIKSYILTGQAATVDAGAAPAGSYAGMGVGTMVIDADTLGSALRTTFEARYNDHDLAAHMAEDSDNACASEDIVSILSTGTVITPIGVSSPFTGPGQGKFTGIKAGIETVLKACFITMSGMSSGGDDYYAATLAAAVDSYLKAGSVRVALKPPFMSGSGMGALT